tara:strand:+ start:79 stop:324 length:246 start_codon:yes stop_codon:yes gene_type:complete
MLISEEKDYFIYGCVSTLFVEGILCIFYGYCCENRCDKLIKERFYPSDNVVLQRTQLITENDNEFENLSGGSSPTESYIDL